MVDNLTPQTPMNPAADSAKKGLSGYLATSSGRVVVGAVALGVVLVAFATVAFVVFKPGSNTAATATTSPSAPPISAPASATPAVEESATPALPVPDSAVFTFRDVFQRPAKKAEESITVPTAPSAETTPPSGLDPDTLYLLDVVSVNGKPNAVLALNGKLYTLPENAVVGDTPWKVLDVRDSAVTMLYGDQQVVLSVGQGMQDK